MEVKNSYHLYGLRAEGEGMLCGSDLEYYIRTDRLNNPLEDGFELMEGVTDVEAGFFDYQPHIRHIMVANSVRHIGVTEKTKEIFAKTIPTSRESSTPTPSNSLRSRAYALSMKTLSSPAWGITTIRETILLP